MDAFWAKVDVGHPLGCWEWTGGRDSKGYGRFGKSGLGTSMAHRISYLLIMGPIPKGLTLDHLCRNRACVNPDHLEPVTRRENILRGYNPAAQYARRQTCAKGHPWDYWDGKQRRCRRCNAEKQRTFQRRKRARARVSS